MALRPQRHAEVEAVLQEIHEYLLALADEIDASEPFTNEHGSTYQVAVQTAAQVTLLRQALQDDQKYQHEFRG